MSLLHYHTMKELNENKKREEDYSVQNCIDIVDTIEELTDEQKTDCNELFQSEMNRQIFVGTKNLKVRLIWLKKKKFSGISNMLITSSAYLENVFLFTLNKIAELCLFRVADLALSMVAIVLLVLEHLPWSNNSISQRIHLMVWCL